jgi:SAM-dependent methyltransferase
LHYAKSRRIITIIVKIFAAPTRKDLIPAFTCSGKNVLEIGVGGSSFSRIILESDPAITLTAIDPFFDTEGALSDFYNHDVNVKKIKPLQTEFGSRYKFILGESPKDLESIPDNSVDWVFVDGDHRHDSALADLQVAQRVIRPGGIIACHDFAVHDRARANLIEVVEATRTFLAKNEGMTFYGIDLSVYPTSILVKQPTRHTIAKLDELLTPWLLYSFQEDSHRLQQFTLQQDLVIKNDRFITRHELSCRDEAAIFETMSERVFSGYYIDHSSLRL